MPRYQTIDRRTGRILYDGGYLGYARDTQEEYTDSLDEDHIQIVEHPVSPEAEADRAQRRADRRIADEARRGRSWVRARLWAARSASFLSRVE